MKKNNKEVYNYNKDMKRELRQDGGDKVIFESSLCFDLEQEMKNKEELIEETICEVLDHDHNCREMIDYKYEIDFKNKQVLVQYTYYYRLLKF